MPPLGREERLDRYRHAAEVLRWRLAPEPAPPGTVRCEDNSAVRRLKLFPLALACLAAAGCTTGPPPPVSAQELAAAETFPLYKLYWAGRTFHGIPVTAVGSLYSYNPHAGEAVYYGNCKPSSSPLGAGTCKLPLKITTAVYIPHSNSSLGRQVNLIARGVPAVRYAGGSAYVLYTAHEEVRVLAESPALAEAAVANLKPLNAPGTTTEPLPLPSFCPSLSGSLPNGVLTLLAHLPGEPCRHSHVLEIGEREA